MQTLLVSQMRFTANTRKEWAKAKNHWNKVLPKVDVKIDIKVRISRPGLFTTPAGLKKKK